MGNTTSITLLQRVRRCDDQTAWSDFVDLYAPLIFAWGQRSGLSETDAADLSQDVLTHLLTALPEFEYSSERGRFRGWLRTVTINKSRELQRQKKLKTKSSDENDFSELESESADIEFWIKEDQQQLVARAMQLMKTHFETPIWQAAWKQIVEEQTPKDIARDSGLSLASVYQARSRVLRKLREQLSDVIDDL